MSSHLEPKTEEEWQKYDALREAQALDLIRESHVLRYFLSQFFSQCGVGATPLSMDANQQYFLMGRHDAAMSIVQKLCNFDTKLYPALLLEEADEQLLRTDPE